MLFCGHKVLQVRVVKAGTLGNQGWMLWVIHRSWIASSVELTQQAICLSEKPAWTPGGDPGEVLCEEEGEGKGERGGEGSERRKQERKKRREGGEEKRRKK